MIVLRCIKTNLGVWQSGLVALPGLLLLVFNPVTRTDVVVLFVAISFGAYAVGATIQTLRYYFITLRYVRYFGATYIQDIAEKGDWYDCPIVGMRLALLDFRTSLA